MDAVNCCTEAEAGMKWCPMVRFNSRGDYPAATNRTPPGEQKEMDDPTRCISSEYMAWRWEDDAEIRGYCGLALEIGK